MLGPDLVACMWFASPPYAVDELDNAEIPPRWHGPTAQSIDISSKLVMLSFDFKLQQRVPY